ncbi:MULTISPECIES: SH3 domain-containing protein [Alphaproteobacteria]|uniref:SH3b domain-containing protein n=2 Tax=Alphaproteobacteria TaxID=28211 RepID=A0A512HLU3_9HYPH|nr:MULTISPECIES: SH3 domain-containing protein [Alphaproteobacteria]GEO86360.1 hypothetical protein RNA01_32920 [Ciceribacter naphthalenivorans]GLR21842.1 hypothetical protein GCM10007920_16290 [Ciceribacter naphthalenivorans]GLT04698.1 hypothetical protein GCM10007926_16290 [Sphingomonas psychrolutea]
MNYLRKFALAAVFTAALPGLAAAANAYSTANVNMRSGPSTQYPAVIIIPAGSRVDIQGCMQSVNWCDVAYAGYRGWVSGSYLQTSYSQRRVYVDPQYYRPLGIPTITFSLGNYWDRHYRGRDFYRDRDRWTDGNYRPRPPARDPDIRRPPAWDPDVRRPPAWDPDIRRPPTRDPDIRRPPIRDPDIRRPPTRDPDVRRPPTRDPDIRRPPTRDPDVRHPPRRDPDAGRPPKDNGKPKSGSSIIICPPGQDCGKRYK